jgi:hypothetical protein
MKRPLSGGRADKARRLFGDRQLARRADCLRTSADQDNLKRALRLHCGRGYTGRSIATCICAAVASVAQAKDGYRTYGKAQTRKVASELEHEFRRAQPAIEHESWRLYVGPGKNRRLNVQERSSYARRRAKSDDERLFHSDLSGVIGLALTSPRRLSDLAATRDSFRPSCVSKTATISKTTPREMKTAINPQDA